VDISNAAWVTAARMMRMMNGLKQK